MESEGLSHKEKNKAWTPSSLASTRSRVRNQKGSKVRLPADKRERIGGHEKERGQKVYIKA